MAVDPHSFFADPDPAVFLNVDPDQAVFIMHIHIRIQLKQFVVKHIKYCSEVRNYGACANLLKLIK